MRTCTWVQTGHLFCINMHTYAAMHTIMHIYIGQGIVILVKSPASSEVWW